MTYHVTFSTVFVIECISNVLILFQYFYYLIYSMSLKNVVMIVFRNIHKNVRKVSKTGLYIK